MASQASTALTTQHLSITRSLLENLDKDMTVKLLYGTWTDTANEAYEAKRTFWLSELTKEIETREKAGRNG